MHSRMAGPSRSHRAARGPSMARQGGRAQWAGYSSRPGAGSSPACSRWAPSCSASRPFDPNRLYWMSRHFVWLIPVVNLGIFLAMGFVGVIARVAWPRGARLAARARPVRADDPAGAPGRLSPDLHRGLRGGGAGDRRTARPADRAARADVPPDRAVQFARGRGDRAGACGRALGGRRHRAFARAGAPLPRRGSPNVLLIVLDTVAAGHLSLYGYGRPTSTTLVELAERGIRFDAAVATSSWTLPSHATMFTGRWLHELSVGWLTPLDRTHPTLAEFLGGRGYATAGFIANTAYCASDSGLGRGFTVYEDLHLPRVHGAQDRRAGQSAAEGPQPDRAVRGRPGRRWPAGSRPCKRSGVRLSSIARGPPGSIASCSTGSRIGQQPDRPFFAFLNYFGCAYPYELPPGRMHRFGDERPDERRRETISRLGRIWTRRAWRGPDLPFADRRLRRLHRRSRRAAREAARRAAADAGSSSRPGSSIAADHGESFGEHAGVFCHGTSLYQTELHVPLLIVPPGGARRVASSRRRSACATWRRRSSTCSISGRIPRSPAPRWHAAGVDRPRRRGRRRILDSRPGRARPRRRALPRCVRAAPEDLAHGCVE